MPDLNAPFDIGDESETPPPSKPPETQRQAEVISLPSSQPIIETAIAQEAPVEKTTTTPEPPAAAPQAPEPPAPVVVARVAAAPVEATPVYQPVSSPAPIVEQAAPAFAPPPAVAPIKLGELTEVFKRLGMTLDGNAQEMSKQVEGIRQEVRYYMREIADRMNREYKLETELSHAHALKAELSIQIISLLETKKQLETLVPEDFAQLLSHLDGERKALTFATLHLLNRLATVSGTAPQFLAELAQSLGLALHQQPQPPSGVLDKAADAVNNLFKKGENQISVRRFRTGEAIEPSFMDGPELQGKRIIGDVKTWAVLASEKVVRKAQITGK